MGTFFGLVTLLVSAGLAGAGAVTWLAIRLDRRFDRRLERIRLRETCGRCGALLEGAGARDACPSCGAPVAPARCRSCGHVITADQHACPACGLSTRRCFCLHCNYNLAGVTGDRCPECGARIAPPPEHDAARAQSTFPTRESIPNS